MQISESLKHFGLAPTTKYLCLVHVAPSSTDAQAVLDKMMQLVDGDLLSLDLLGSLPEGGTNEKSIKKVRCFARFGLQCIHAQQPCLLV